MGKIYIYAYVKEPWIMHDNTPRKRPVDPGTRYWENAPCFWIQRHEQQERRHISLKVKAGTHTGFFQ